MMQLFPVASAEGIDGGKGLCKADALVLIEQLGTETRWLLLALVLAVCYGGMLMALKGTSPVRALLEGARKSGDHPDLFPVSP